MQGISVGSSLLFGRILFTFLDHRFRSDCKIISTNDGMTEINLCSSVAVSPKSSSSYSSSERRGGRRQRGEWICCKGIKDRTNCTRLEFVNLLH